MTQHDWERRINRARQLAQEYSAAAEVLTFYAEIAAFQQAVFDAAVRQNLHADPMRPFGEQLVASAPLDRFPALLELVGSKGPAGLAKGARELRQQGPDQWRLLLASQPDGTDPTQDFFARVYLQPIAERLAADADFQITGYTGVLCPICNGKPQLSVLRPEGDGGKRSLLCSCCSTEWDFRRILCPNCSEKDPGKLQRFSAEDFPHMRIEACDTCKRYQKGVDLTINGLAVPIVDEIAAVPLDLWAAEQGYGKIALNVMGL
ncbi:MAG TPA: formate dehydrogenase accessory protein FdhE [Terriglobales bacterium]|nr:formate dehydrogenase accessory protein FdhE [Terriglobales bacterium]